MIRDPEVLGPSFDLQVNGYAGVDFNAPDLSLERVEYACEQLAGDCVAGVLVAVVTADVKAMCERIGRLTEFIQSSPLVSRTVRGIHVEGPFISDRPGFVGAHPPEHTTDADAETMQRLLDAGEGFVRLVTLAPERDDRCRVVQMLTDRGVAVSAG